jgi:ornithine cyclodeaminase/alanine dehydrogenase
MSKSVFISDTTVRELLGWPDMIDAIRRTYGAPHPPGVSPPRALARDGGVWMRTLTGLDPAGRFMGVKQFGLSRQKRLNYLITLFDKDNGDLVAMLDGHAITALRTAATSAAAADRLAPRGPLRMGVLGSGTEAWGHVRAMQAIRPIELATIYSTNPDRRAAFARKFEEETGVRTATADTPRDAVAGQQLIIGATRTRDGMPVIHGEWIEDGALTVSIGATLRDQHEVDSAAIRTADLIVADNPHEVMEETGCFLTAKAEGVVFEYKFVSLNALLTGEADDRVAASRRPMYRSVGGPLQDIAVGTLAYERALAAGRTIELPIEFAVKAD